MLGYVGALHDCASECLEVLEREDDLGDGWRASAGKTGLPRRNYTTPQPPYPQSSFHPLEDHDSSQMAATLGEAPTAPDQVETGHGIQSNEADQTRMIFASGTDSGNNRGASCQVLAERTRRELGNHQRTVGKAAAPPTSLAMSVESENEPDQDAHDVKGLMPNGFRSTLTGIQPPITPTFSALGKPTIGASMLPFELANPQESAASRKTSLPILQPSPLPSHFIMTNPDTASGQASPVSPPEATAVLVEESDIKATFIPEASGLFAQRLATGVSLPAPPPLAGPPLAGPPAASLLTSKPPPAEPAATEGSQSFAIKATEPLAEQLRQGTPLLNTPFRQVVLTSDRKRVIKRGAQGVLQSEIRSMQFVDQSTCVPVPGNSELVVEGNISYLIMDYVDSLTLEKAWPNMSEEDRQAVLEDLKGFLEQLRRLKQHTVGDGPSLNTALIGSIDGGPCLDPWICPQSEHVDDENSWNRRLITKVGNVPEWVQRRLPTRSDIIFCHADLRPSNILVKNGRVVCILDWERAGWYPAYWEWCQAADANTRLRDWTSRLDEWLEPDDAYFIILWFKGHSSPW